MTAAFTFPPFPSMPIVLSAHSLAQRRFRKAAASRSSTTFSFVIFLIAVSTFTVWSLGASTCSTPSEQQQLLAYYRTEATFAKACHSVLLLLQQISDHLHHILPAVVTVLLLSHDRESQLPGEGHSQEVEGGGHQAELSKERSAAELLHLLFQAQVGGQQQSEEPAAASA